MKKKAFVVVVRENNLTNKKNVVIINKYRI